MSQLKERVEVYQGHATAISKLSKNELIALHTELQNALFNVGSVLKHTTAQ